MGEEIQIRMKLFRLTYTWLIHQLSRRGFKVDKTEMSGFISGARHGAKADAVLLESAKILDSYERWNGTKEVG